MTPETTYNDLPKGFKGEQQRRSKFESLEEKFSYDADGLIALAKNTYKNRIVTVREVIDLSTRADDNMNDLRKAVDIKLKNPEQIEIDKRLIPLVVKPINALPEANRLVKGKVRSGEEIARAIPDVEAFLDAVSLRKDGKFFELNEEGQLVIEDGYPDVYGIGEAFLKAKMRQACIWYLDEQGTTQSLQGKDLYTVKKVDNEVLVLELTDTAKKVVPTMVSGLPTLKWNGEKHTGEYARMNRGQLETLKETWTDDDSLHHSLARYAVYGEHDGPYGVYSYVYGSHDRCLYRGSRGVLRVNLNFEIADATQERQLSPETAEHTLSTLETRFNANSYLHEGYDWGKVKTALEANPEALWSVNQMEAQGHMPDFYNFDNTGFDIGTCSKEAPESARNCVYDAQAAAWLKENYPNEKFNGSAFELAEAMGISLMSPEQYKDILQNKRKFDEKTWSWLKAPDKTRKAGFAPRGDRYDCDVYTLRTDANFHDDAGAWRGSLRVSWT